VFSVVTNCTGKKLGVAAPARLLYRGPSVQRVAKAVDEVRAHGVPVSLYIISAKYGLVHEDQVLEPYDETLGGLPPEEIKRWARRVGVVEGVERMARSSTVILVASKPYYTAVETSTNTWRLRSSYSNYGNNATRRKHRQRVCSISTPSAARHIQKNHQPVSYRRNLSVGSSTRHPSPRSPARWCGNQKLLQEGV
jgi:hypothetical protein